MHQPSRRAALVAVLASVLAPTVRGQSSGGSPAATISLPDSVFQPIRLPAAMAYGYPPNEVYVPRFIELIRRRDFNALELALDSIQADVARDVRHEVRFADAFQASVRDDTTLVEDQCLDGGAAALRTRACRCREPPFRHCLATSRPGHDCGNAPGNPPG